MSILSLMTRVVELPKSGLSALTIIFKTNPVHMYLKWYNLDILLGKSQFNHSNHGSKHTLEVSYEDKHK